MGLMPCPWCKGTVKEMKFEIEGYESSGVWRVACTTPGCLVIGPVGGQGEIGRVVAITKWDALVERKPPTGS